MGKKYVYVCNSCGKLFTSQYGRDPNLACPKCGGGSTFLCSEDKWLELDDDERRELTGGYVPAEVVQRANERSTYGAHAARPKPPGSTAALALGIVGAIVFIIAGGQMLAITSVSSYYGDGGSIMEPFYHAMGWFSFGMAFVSATLGCLGWKR